MVGAMAGAMVMVMVMVMAVVVVVARYRVAGAVAVAVAGAVANFKECENDLDDSRICVSGVVYGLPVAGSAIRLLSLPAG